MAGQDDDQSVRLSEVFRRITRHWRLIVAITALCALAGAGYSLLQEKQYTASATLTVSPITTNPFNAGAVNQQINITTEREILSSREVARIAAETLDTGVSPAQLLAGSEVSAPSGSQVLEVTVTADRPEDAADFANALAEAYLEFRAEGAADVALGFIDELDRRIATLEQAETLDPAARAELSSLRDQRASLSLVAENPGRIIGEAAAPSSPSSPGLASWILIGTAVGLLLGAVAAFIRDRFDPVLRSASKLRERTTERIIVFEDEDDQEAARWMIRALLDRQERPGGGTDQLRVLLLDLDGHALERFASTLLNVLRDAPLRSGVAVMDGRTFPVALHGAGATPDDGDLDVVFVDASAVQDAPARATLADTASCVVLVASARTRGEVLDAVLQDLGNGMASRAPAVVFAFLDNASTADAAASGRRHRRRSGELPGTVPAQTP